jgi:spore maturation protein CgeB
VDLAQACRRRGIPSVYWNKEDPVHFDRFLPVALACDVILTSDSDCIDRYRAAGFGGIVAAMAFPAQPKLHRQYLDKEPEKTVFFAGTYRPHHPDRVRSYHNIIVPALDYGLHIFSRRGQWPEECAPHIVGSYDYLDLIRKYSAYGIGLNISSVQNSPTMFPRRVVEMPLANVFVISDQSRALSKLFPAIPQSESAEQTKALLAHFLHNEAERTAILEQLKESILRNHTYTCELARIRDMLGQLRG